MHMDGHYPQTTANIQFRHCSIRLTLICTKIKNYVRDINGYLRLNIFSLITGNQHLSNAGSFYLFYQKGREAGKGSGRKQALRDVLHVIHEKPLAFPERVCNIVHAAADWGHHLQSLYKINAQRDTIRRMLCTQH